MNYDPTIIPLGLAPPGQNNDLINAPSQAWMPRVAIYTTFPIAVAFTVLRIYSALKLRQKLGWDDYLSILALSASAGFCGVLLSLVVDEMYGRHYWNLPVSFITDGLMQRTAAVTAVYCWAAALTKLSLCVLFHRIFSLKPWAFGMIRVGIIFISISYATLFGVWLAYLNPRPGDSGWSDPKLSERTREQAPLISVVLGALNVFTDFYVISIPFMAVSSLKLSASRRYGVLALFATGLVACAFSVAGLPLRVKTYTATINGIPDPFWASMPPVGLAVSEINLGIVCACVPVSVPVLKTISTKLSSAGSSLGQYFSSYQKHSTPSRKDAEPPAMGFSPQIPQGNLRTLRSFFHLPQATQQKSSHQTVIVTNAVDIEMAPYSELRSVDMEYHSYLVPGQVSSHQALVTNGTKPGQS